MQVLKRENNQKFEEKEAVKFLIAEYNQSFEQMRHYNKMQSNLISFSLSGYMAILSLACAIYEFVKSYDFKIRILSLLLIISSFMGGFLLLLFIRNRLYYVIVARQINSLRNYFLNNSKLNYIDYNKLYLSPDNPKNYNIWSTDSIFIYSISFINSLLFASGIFIFFLRNKKWGWFGFIVLILIHSLIYLLIVIKQLINKDDKSADENIFGVKKGGHIDVKN